MLFYITERIVTEAEKNNLRVIEVLEFVAQSHFYGRHIVFSTREILGRLSRISFFNDKRTVEVFRSVLNKYATLGGIQKVISLRVELVLDEQFQVSSDRDGRYTVIYCPVTCKSLENLMMGTEVLGENVEELSMYEFMGNYYLRKHNLQINTYQKKLHGGGDTLRLVWSNEASQNNFCLAFLDSDKKWHKGSLGDTLKKVIDVQQKEKYCTADYIYSDLYREIENMIPFDILKIVSQKNVDWNRGFADIDTIIKAGKDVRYYDMKYGFTLKKYKKLQGKEGEKKYVNMQLSCLYSQYSDLGKWMQGLEENAILLHGLGADVLIRSVEYLKDNFENWLANALLDPLLEQEWVRIGKELVNWTCASSKIRI